MFVTYQDAIEHLVDFLGGDPAESVVRDCRRAVLEAYRDLANAHRWSYFTTHGRVVTSAPFNDGTIGYRQSDGGMPRMVTLTTTDGGVWPAWAALGGMLRVGFQGWRVRERVSNAVLVLDELVNPGVDVPDGTAYVLYRDTYVLPADFIAGDQALYERNFGGMQYVHPREWLFEERFIFAQGIPQCYTITGDSRYPGRLVLRLAPYPSDGKTVDFLYQRRPRPLGIAAESAGRVSMAADGMAVLGAGAAFTPAMEGSILRVSGVPGRPPTSPIGGLAGPANPPVLETVVLHVASPTGLFVADPAPYDLGALPYTVSDPVDLELGAMLTAFWRCCEAQEVIARRSKDRPAVQQAYDRALREAKAADSRSLMGRSCYDRWPVRPRLRDMPIDFSDPPEAGL